MQMCPDCGKVYDESDYGYCPYCSGILNENKSERPFKHCPCCGNTMYWDEFWECTNCDYSCCHKGSCAFNAVWRAADMVLKDLYSSISLKDLFDQGENHPVIQAAFALESKK